MLPAETKRAPLTFDNVVFGCPTIPAMLIEPDDTNISANGFANVPNVAPLGVEGTILPPKVVVPVIDKLPSIT